MLLSLEIKANQFENKITKRNGNGLLIKLKAPREKGLANKALFKTLSKEFKIPQSAITIKSGKTSTKKIIEIETAYAGRVFERLSTLS